MGWCFIFKILGRRCLNHHRTMVGFSSPRHNGAWWHIWRCPESVGDDISIFRTSEVDGLMVVMIFGKEQ